MKCSRAAPVRSCAARALREYVRAVAAIIPPESYDRWLSTLDPDPRDLLVPYPAGPIPMWPISIRVNKPENDDPSILERVNEPVGIVAK
jgi:putative SOS response-associated peptidase YedK